MIFRLFRKSSAADAVYALYSAIVAQSRRPVFYAEWGVPDTVTGRFDMISIHLALVLRRLRSKGADAAAFSQELFDLFFRDMDRSLRELGVSDLGVPKKIKKMGSAFYGLLARLSEALDRGDRENLEGILARNVYSEGSPGDAGALARYLMDEAARLEMMPIDGILAGRLQKELAA